MGAVKTAGRGKEPEDSPWADQTVTVGRAAIFYGSIKVDKGYICTNKDDLKDEEAFACYSPNFVASQHGNAKFRDLRHFLRRYRKVCVALCASLPRR